MEGTRLPCEVNTDTTDRTDTTYTETSTEETSAEDVKIKISIGEEFSIVRLENKDAAKDFKSMLPLTLDFNDFNGTEKIAYLPRDLDISNTTGGIQPPAVDFTLYAPWGNLAIFYNSFHYSDDLIKLGVIEAGLDILTKQTGNFTATIDFVEHTPKVLTAYFSATGNTKSVAEKISTIAKSNVFEIQPTQPYTSSDLNYSNSNCRANIEQNDPNVRPKISNKTSNIDNYDVIFSGYPMGYPIW